MWVGVGAGVGARVGIEIDFIQARVGVGVGVAKIRSTPQPCFTVSVAPKTCPSSWHRRPSLAPWVCQRHESRLACQGRQGTIDKTIFMLGEINEP